MRSVNGRPVCNQTSRHPREGPWSRARWLSDCVRLTNLDADPREQAAHVVDAAGLEIGLQLVAESLRHGRMS